MAIRLVPNSDSISWNGITVPFTCVSKGGNWNGGRPEATWPVMAKGMLPVLRSRM